MKKLLATVPMVLVFLCALHAQTPVIEWQKCLGGAAADYGTSISATADGGYILAGITQSDGGDVKGLHAMAGLAADFWVVKLDAKGSISWQKCLGGIGYEYQPYIRQTADGGYILAGAAGSSDCNFAGAHGDLDFVLIKLSPPGEVVWQKLYGGSGREWLNAFDIAPDGGYLLAGNSSSVDGDVTGNRGNSDFWVVKTDAAGNLQWQKSLGSSSIDMANAVKATADGGCILAGFAMANDGDVTGWHGLEDYWVVKLASGGMLEWQRSIGGTGIDIARCVDITTDGGYIVGGYSASSDGDAPLGTSPALRTDYWIVKLAGNGAMQWNKRYGNTADEDLLDIRALPDGGFLLVGSVDKLQTCNSGGYEAWLLKTDAIGTVQWEKRFGGNGDDIPGCIQPLTDGGFIITGYTNSHNMPGHHTATSNNSVISDNDCWVAKFSAPIVTAPDPVLTIQPATGSICAGATVTFTANTLYAGSSPLFQWMKNGFLVGTEASYSASNLANGDVLTCFAKLNDPCIPASTWVNSSVTIAVNNTLLHPLFSVNANNTLVCPCTPVTFTAIVNGGGALPQYQWLVNGVKTGSSSATYISTLLKAEDVVSCEYTDNSACVAGGKVVSNIVTMVSGWVLPTVEVKMADTLICAGEEVAFKATATNAGIAPAYHWTINGIAAGTNADTLTIVAPVDGDVVSCAVDVDPLFVCAGGNAANGNPITITVVNEPAATAAIAVLANGVCAGTPLAFTAQATGVGTAPAYQWMVNNARINNTAAQFNSAGLVNGDEIYCIVTPLQNHCVTDPIHTDTVIASVYEMPQVTISPANTAIYAGNNASLQATITGSSTSFSWQPADQLTNPLLLNTTTLPLSESTQYTLLVTTDKGCSASATAVVKVSKALVMPNAFTPNNDGRNDVFRIPAGVVMTVEEFSIFDRWGNKVFTTKDVSAGWDGRYKGQPASEGVYVYILRGAMTNEPIVKKGQVVLVR